MGDYTVVKPCLASVFSFMLLEFRFWVSIQKQTFNQIAQYSLHLVTLISFLAILGMSDNIPSLDQIDFFSSFQFTLLLCFFYYLL
jgi:hypothetical protein